MVSSAATRRSGLKRAASQSPASHGGTDTGENATKKGSSTKKSRTNSYTDKIEQEKEEEMDKFTRIVKRILQKDIIADGEWIKEHMESMENLSLTKWLDRLLTAAVKGKDEDPKKILSKLSVSARHRVCGHTFGSDEIAFSCRTCRTDPSCVMCQTCFTNSNHAGHDVHFQRTTAGGCCDCGDPEAWVPSGFCCSHPGLTKKTNEKAEYAVQKLPAGIKLLAPTIIDAVLQEVFDTVLLREESFALALVLTKLYRSTPSSLWTKEASEATDTSRPRRTNLSKHSHDDDEKDPLKMKYLVILHHDDNHPSSVVCRKISKILNCSDLFANIQRTKLIERGEEILITEDLKTCVPVVAELVEGDFLVSVVPSSQYQREVRAEMLLMWLHRLCSGSDGLANIINSAVCAIRQPSVESPVKEDISTTEIRGLCQKYLNRTTFLMLKNRSEALGAQKNRGQPGLKKTRSSKRARAGKASSKTSKARSCEPTINLKCTNSLIKACVPFFQHCYDEPAPKHFNMEQKDEFFRFISSYASPITPVSTLGLLVRNSSILKKRLSRPTNKLFHELILNVQFKSKLMNVFLQSYKKNSLALAKGLAYLEDSIFDFSVQLFSVPSLVKMHALPEQQQGLVNVNSHHSSDTIINVILESLFMVLNLATDETADFQPSSVIISRQSRYRHCIDNLEHLLNVPGMSSMIMSSEEYLKKWLKTLSIIQNEDQQRRRGQYEDHVEYESDSWISMFNLCIRLHSLFATLSKGLYDKGAIALLEKIDLPLLFSCMLKAVADKHKDVRCVGSIKSLSAMLLPVPDAATSYYQTTGFDVSTEPVSFHLPLHRFYAAAVKRHLVSVRLDNYSTSWLASVGLSHFAQQDESNRLIFMDYPLRCLVMSAQIRSNLWRRNGEENMMAQIFNYTTLPFCVQFQDADIFLMQLSVLLFGPDEFCSLLIDRFQLCSYFFHESATQPARHHYTLPKEVAADNQRLLRMVEECLRLLIVIGTDLPSSYGMDYEREAIRLEVLHQLCAKSLTFSDLNEIAIMPGGQDEVPTTELETALDRVGTYRKPTGLEPGRYELKEKLVEEYNPYFLHLSRESHQLARDRWNRCNNKLKAARKSTLPPVAKPSTPITALAQVPLLLIADNAVGLVGSILLRLHTQLQSQQQSYEDLNDTVLSCALHLLCYGTHIAKANAENADNDMKDKATTFYESVAKRKVLTSEYSVLRLLLDIQEKHRRSLVDEQKHSIEWIINTLKTDNSVCKNIYTEYFASQHKTSGPVAHVATAVAPSAATTPALDQDHRDRMKLEQRKKARERAIALMAKQRAAFMKTMDTDEGEDTGDITSTPTPESVSASDDASSVKTSADDGSDSIKEAQPTLNCILCHDSSNPEQLGYAAYLQHSTVMNCSYRPNKTTALTPKGIDERMKIAKVLQKYQYFMQTASSGTSPIPTGVISRTAELAAQTSIDEFARNEIRNRLNGHEGEGQADFLDWFNPDTTPSGLPGDPDHTAISTSSYASLARALGEYNQAHRQDDEEESMSDSSSSTTSSDEVSDGEIDVESPPFLELELVPGDNVASAFISRNVTSSRKSFVVTPSGIHLRTCRHAVHINCLERYISSLHEKAERGEDVDGFQAIDMDAVMAQFLCPMCKTLSNILIPTDQCLDEPNTRIVAGSSRRKPLSKELGTLLPANAPSMAQWSGLLEEQLQLQSWCRKLVPAQKKAYSNQGFTTSQIVNHWRDYFEDVLWEPHGSLDKSIPFLWSSCAFTVASLLACAEAEIDSRRVSCDKFEQYPAIAREGPSVGTLIKFCRWSFHGLCSGNEANIVYEVTKRCCPLFQESNREKKKFDAMLYQVTDCLAGVVFGLRFADTFTCFVTSCVLAESHDLASRFIPIFYACELMYQLRRKFFLLNEEYLAEQMGCLDDYRALNHDEYTLPSEAEPESKSSRRSSLRQSGSVKSGPSVPNSAAAMKQVKALIKRLESSSSKPESSRRALNALKLVERLSSFLPKESVTKITLTKLEQQIEEVMEQANLFYRRACLYLYCLNVTSTPRRSFSQLLQAVELPQLDEIYDLSDDLFEQICTWSLNRFAKDIFFRGPEATKHCAHASGMRDGFIARTFSLEQSMPSSQIPELIDLPEQYDALYSQYATHKCDRCKTVPSKPGLCLICGEYLCCGAGCCTFAYGSQGPVVGECTRHAIECGAGVGIVLLVLQCRVILIGGSLATRFPCPYVDAHGEEDNGLQRGRPLKLDQTRYELIQALWRANRIHTEVSRQRNQTSQQDLIEPSLM